VTIMFGFFGGKHKGSVVEDVAIINSAGDLVHDREVASARIRRAKSEQGHDMLVAAAAAAAGIQVAARQRDEARRDAEHWFTEDAISRVHSFSHSIAVKTLARDLAAATGRSFDDVMRDINNVRSRAWDKRVAVLIENRTFKTAPDLPDWYVAAEPSAEAPAP